MVLEVLEQEIRYVIHELLTDTTNSFCGKDLECCAPADKCLSPDAIEVQVKKKEFHVHIADFVDCVTGKAKLPDGMYVNCS